MWKFIPMYHPIGASKGILFHQRGDRGTSVSSKGVVGVPLFHLRGWLEDTPVSSKGVVDG